MFLFKNENQCKWFQLQREFLRNDENALVNVLQLHGINLFYIIDQEMARMWEHISDTIIINYLLIATVFLHS